MDNNLTNSELELIKNIDEDFDFSEPVLNCENSTDKASIFKQIESLQYAVETLLEINKLKSTLSNLNEEDTESCELIKKITALEVEFSSRYASYDKLINETESNISSGFVSMEDIIENLNSLLN
jgi:oligoendopeptidase F